MEIPALGHEISYTDNGDGTHTEGCARCDYSATEPCVYEDGVCVWDDHDIKIIARHLEPCYGSSAELVLLIENRTSSYVYLATDTVKINGIAVDLFGNEMLSSNSYAISSLLIDEDALTAQNIQSIDSISLQFEITVHDQAGTELKTDLVEIPVVY